ncbi:TIGR04325 family methyltransferase [Methanolobus vulcani]|uniref:Methyltransferase, TIGR04325 family n=1 Tax=Methanolobus vulcani TaxID=38026 RepID=A0A7Z8KLP1_9EURY|nr:TIGR04325 family methyltransferase [Methanolobus vulcani]TQD23856.1 methyltransferase, TIGR04325 family [Methanolobus vulcani]
MDNLKSILKCLTPPILWSSLQKLHNSKYGWFGDYNSWTDANKCAVGYDNDIILQKVKSSLLKVKNNEAIYERDSVLYDKIEYSWPLLASLLWIAGQNNNNLNIIDFGGSLGSTYFQNKKFLSSLNDLKWNIVEQANFVECGKSYFEDNTIKYYFNIDTCLEENNPNTLLFSSSIQYIEKPYDFLTKILEYQFEYIIFDLTGIVIGEDRDILTIQKIHPGIYKASYPCWFFDKKKLLNTFANKYTLIEEFNNQLGQNIEIDNRFHAKYQGFIFKKRTEENAK